MAVPSIVDTASAWANDNTVPSISIPVLPSGNSHVAFLTTSDDNSLATVSEPSGWVEVANGSTSDGYVGYRIYTGGPGAGLSWSVSGGSYGMTLLVVGLDASSPTLVVDSTEGSTISPAVSAAADSLVIRWLTAQVWNSGQFSAPYPAGSPDNHTWLCARNLQPGDSYAVDTNLQALCSANQTSSGSTNTSTWSSFTTGGSYSTFVHTVSITGILNTPVPLNWVAGING